VGKAASVTAEGYETARPVFALGAESAKRRIGAKCARQRSDGRFPGRPDVAAGAREAGSRGLVVDVVLFARSLRAVTASSTAARTRGSSSLTSESRRSARAGRSWASELAELALRPNGACKLSGLMTEGNRER